jgi:predicted nuclease of predicted toxin-antitoxin system
MKILLDESLPRKLRSDFDSEHEVWTVRDKGWLGKKNGELLKLMIADNFELFITVDKNLPYQQNLERLPLTIFVLNAKDNRRSTLQKLIPLVFERINIGNLQNVIEISNN